MMPSVGKKKIEVEEEKTIKKINGNESLKLNGFPGKSIVRK